MRNRCTLLFLILGALLFCSPAFGQGSPTVFVTDGTDGTIRAFDTGTSLFSTVHTFSGARLEGLTYGPDGKLYACDPTNGNIYRVKPDGTDPEQVLVFEDVAPTQPQCGRFSSVGDFYIVDEAGTGVWMFAASALASLPATPTKVLGTTELGDSFGGSGDITQANKGDLLIDDFNDGKVFLVPYPFPPFPGSALSPLISGLTNATGIARSSTSDIFISERGGVELNKIVRYSSTGSSLGDCGSFGSSNQPYFIKFSADDTLYVATSQPGEGPINGKLWKEDISACGSPSFLTDMPVIDSETHFAAIGVALPPTSTATETKAISTPAGRNFNFNFSSFQISQTTPASCSASVKATQTPLATLEAAFTPPSGSFIPYLGEAGFGTVYSVATPVDEQPTCTNGEVLVGAFTPSLLNPRIIKCDPNLAGTCSILTTNAVYPLGGPLPGDGSLGGSAGGFSDFFVIDEGLSTDPSVKGNFCGFNPPLTNTTDPASAPVFSLSTTGTIPVKFLLGKTASCKSFITDATALLSVAEVDSGFAPIFPLKFNGQGSSSAIFGVTGKQYHLNLDVTGYVAPGTYSVCVAFLTGNAAPVCTYFKLVP